MMGLAWLMLDKVGILLLSTLSTFWYAKLLGPSGFGQAAVILAVYQILVMAFGSVQQFPLVAVEKNHQKEFETSAFGWALISLGVSSITLLAFWLLWDKAAVLYSLMPCAALIIVSQSKVYLADLLRGQKFKSMAYRQTISRLVSVAVGLTLAYYQYPMWAVIVQWSLEPFISYCILRTQSNFRLQRSFNSVLFLSQIKQGGPLLVKSLSQEMKGRGLIVLLGVFVSESASAYYSLALKFVDVIRSFFIYSFASFSLTKFVAARDKPARLLGLYESMSVLLVSIMVPVCFGMASLSQAIVAIFFSPEWGQVAMFVYWLCLLEAVVSIVALVQTFQMATFNSQNTLFSDGLSVIVIPVVFCVGQYFLGEFAVILACCAHAAIMLPFYFRSVFKITGNLMKTMYTSMFFIILTGFIMSVFVSYSGVESNFLSIVLMTILGGVCYIIIYFIFMMLRLINASFLKKEDFL